MSAKKSKPASPDLDFKRASSGAPVDASSVRSAVDIVAFARTGTPAQKLVAQRTLLLAQPIWEALQASREASSNAPAAAPARRGRPKNEALDRAIRECEFDICDLDRLREIGWGKVMTDKEVVDKAITRNWSTPTEPNAQDRKRGAIRVALHRRRNAQG